MSFFQSRMSRIVRSSSRNGARRFAVAYLVALLLVAALLTDVGCDSATTTTKLPASTAAADSVESPPAADLPTSQALPPAGVASAAVETPAGVADDQRAAEVQLAAAEPKAEGGGPAAPANPSSSTAAVKKPKFDPVAVNGPLFVDWPAPQFALLITGLQQGYLEPCGCAGLENQKGGLARRHSLIKDLEGRTWPLVTLDAGGLVRRFGRQEEIKYQTTLEALRTLRYEAVGFGASDLALPAENLLAATGDLQDDAGQSRFVSANVGLFGLANNAVPKFRIITIGGVRVGITSVLGDSVAKQVGNQEIEVAPAAQALAEVVEQLKSAADVRVLLIQSTMAEATELVKKFPVFDVAAVAEGEDEPRRTPTVVEGTKTQVVTMGHKGMYAAVLGYYVDSEPHWRYQRVPLDSRFGDSPEMKQLMSAYQENLQALGLEGLGIRPVIHPRAGKAGGSRGQFAGAASCAECHPTAHGIWSKTAHAHATDSLIHKSVPPRQFDPECLSCHVTGWKPLEYIPYESGFASMEATPHLAGNSCENCHGPGAAHVAAEQARGAELNLSLRNQLRAELQLTRATAKEVCLQCHDEDNSPEFKFESYWPKVEHKGKK